MKKFMFTVLVFGNFTLAFAADEQPEVTAQVPVLQEQVKVELTAEQKKQVHFAICRQLRISVIGFIVDRIPSVEKLEAVRKGLQDAGCSTSDWADVDALRKILATVHDELDNPPFSKEFLRSKAAEEEVSALVQQFSSAYKAVGELAPKRMSELSNNADNTQK